MMTELGLNSDAVAVARHYGALLDGFVLDSSDADRETAVRALGVDVLVTDTVMQTLADKERLARDVVAFAATLRR
jgi:LPPG:FO 2-phospho-L-lactate transferase